MKAAERFTIHERAVRYQRRYSGPFRVVNREVVPVGVADRYRRRVRIEWAELNVARHDVWTHVLWRGVALPLSEDAKAILMFPINLVKTLFWTIYWIVAAMIRGGGDD